MCESIGVAGSVRGGLGPHASASIPAQPLPPQACHSCDKPAAGKRMRLWDLPQRYHCPIIGTCLHVDELRRLAQKADCTPKHALSDFEVHVSFVAAAESRNPLSQAVQRRLDRKYATIIKRFARAREPAALRHLWDEAMANGEVQGAFWAVMSHAHATQAARSRAYEDVHMLSHQIGAGLNADLKALAETRETLARVRRDAAAAAARAERTLAERTARLAEAEQRLSALQGTEATLAAARERLTALESGAELRALRARVDAQDQEIADLRGTAREHAATVDDCRERLAASEHRRAEASAQLADREASLGALEALLAAALSADECACEEDCAACPNTGEGHAEGIDLSGRRILCVGGRGSLSAHYRALVERCNGELVRHDGGLEDSRARLETLLASADAVICPVDSVSHDASLRTKRFCKRHAKPCVIMKRSGIGAFALALSQIGMSPQFAGAQENTPCLLHA